MRTVPESALPRNDPTSYTGTHARRRFVPLSIDHRCLHLDVCQCCIGVPVEEVKELTLTRREEMVTAILRLAFSRFCEGTRSKLHSDQQAKTMKNGWRTYRRSLIMSLIVPSAKDKEWWWQGTNGSVQVAVEGKVVLREESSRTTASHSCM
ncbi:hypothetical protein SCHPADRAFT_376862 [Schizopora paradoxa]|uniref:Uncharacterized protein n=1 Tax=Schizopora paradoxa TaxID=27342 RepID=A0A0H2RUT6_9AGAM|nr:hypothetical protein SCHPADRAFT_376862 [Schizopora paradoxa]